MIVHTGYNLVSKEAINLFLKGFGKNRNLLDKVFTPPVPTAYGAMKMKARRGLQVPKSSRIAVLDLDTKIEA